MSFDLATIHAGLSVEPAFETNWCKYRKKLRK